MMKKKKSGHKIEKVFLEHVVDYDTFMNDEELRKKYCEIDIERVATPYNIMNLDEFIASESKWKEEFKREEID